MVGVYYQIVAIGHLTIKTHHTSLGGSHFFHTTHKFLLRNHNGHAFCIQGSKANPEIIVFIFGQFGFKDTAKGILLIGG